jgi:hypothetical protein
MSNWLRVIGGWMMLDVLFGGAASDHLYRSHQGRQGRQVQGRAGTLTIVGTPHNQKQCEWGPDDSLRRGRCCMHLDHWRELRSKFGWVSRPVSAEPFLSPVGPVSRPHYTARTDSTKQTLGNDMVAQGLLSPAPCMHAGFKVVGSMGRVCGRWRRVALVVRVVMTRRPGSVQTTVAERSPRSREVH